MLQRAVVGTAVARVLGFRPSDTDDIAKAEGMGLPSFLLHKPLWEWASAVSPEGTWLDVFQVVSAAWSDHRERDKLVHSLLTRVAPDSVGPVMGLLSGDMTVEESNALVASVVNPQAIQAGVTRLVAGPDTLVRCPDCLEPYYTDGVRLCPFCKE